MPKTHTRDTLIWLGGLVAGLYPHLDQWYWTWWQAITYNFNTHHTLTWATQLWMILKFCSYAHFTLNQQLNQSQIILPAFQIFNIQKAKVHRSANNALVFTINCTLLWKFADTCMENSINLRWFDSVISSDRSSLSYDAPLDVTYYPSAASFCLFTQPNATIVLYQSFYIAKLSSMQNRRTNTSYATHATNKQTMQKKFQEKCHNACRQQYLSTMYRCCNAPRIKAKNDSMYPRP